MTPAQELRAAVKTLRCDHSFPVLPPLGSLVHPGDCSKCGVVWGHHEVVADDLAPLLAAWLEASAAHASKVQDPRNQEIIADQHALKVARLLLGGAS